ncbi:MAG: hypothetical protein D6679_08445 [Candidatus Hydrogenedentota bacterium]|nr:MAG: hypothetical protein D6679_08445 [Candidatus Hydrogenedentota bacterium]
MTQGSRVGGRLCVFLGAAAVVMISTAVVKAGPVGRPVTTEKQWAVGGGYSWDEFKIDAKGTTLTGEATASTGYIEAAFGFANNVEGYLRLGGGSEDLSSNQLRVDYGSGLMWGLGVRGTMYESYQGWRLLGDLQWLSRPSRSVGIADIDITEIQAAGLLEFDMQTFRPYVGFGWSRFEAASNNQGLVPTVRSKNNLSLILGGGFEPREEWSLFLEGRFINTISFSGGVFRRF